MSPKQFDVCRVTRWQPFTRQGQQKDDADLRSAGLLHLIEVMLLLLLPLLLLLLLLLLYIYSRHEHDRAFRFWGQ